MLIELGLELAGRHDGHGVKLRTNKDTIEHLVFGCWLIERLDVIANSVLCHFVPCLRLHAHSALD